MTMMTTAETIELKNSFLPDLLAFGDYLYKRGYQLMPNYAEETLALLAGSYFDRPDVSLWNYQLLLKPLMVKSPAEAQHFQEDLRNYLQLKKVCGIKKRTWPETMRNLLASCGNLTRKRPVWKKKAGN